MHRLNITIIKYVLQHLHTSPEERCGGSQTSAPPTASLIYALVTPPHSPLPPTSPCTPHHTRAVTKYRYRKCCFKTHAEKWHVFLLGSQLNYRKEAQTNLEWAVSRYSFLKNPPPWQFKEVRRVTLTLQGSNLKNGGNNRGR